MNKSDKKFNILKVDPDNKFNFDCVKTNKNLLYVEQFIFDDPSAMMTKTVGILELSPTHVVKQILVDQVNGVVYVLTRVSDSTEETTVITAFNIYELVNKGNSSQTRTMTKPDINGLVLESNAESSLDLEQQDLRRVLETK